MSAGMQLAGHTPAAMPGMTPGISRKQLAATFHCHHDPVRCPMALQSDWYQLLYAGSPAAAVISAGASIGAPAAAAAAVPQQQPDAAPQLLGSTPEVLVLGVTPGPGCGNPARPSYSVFVQQPAEQQEQLWRWVGHVLDQQLRPAQGMSLTSVPQHAVATVVGALTAAGYHLTCDEPCLRFYLRDVLSPALEEALTAPDELNLHEQGAPQCFRMQLGSLHQRHTDLVNDNWAYKDCTSRALVSSIIASNQTVCVFLSHGKKGTPQQQPASSSGNDCASTKQVLNGEATQVVPHIIKPQEGSTDVRAPIAWAVQYHDGRIGMAHTDPKYRRKGIMALCMAHLCRQVLQRQPEVFTFVGLDNHASANLMRKLGFQQAITTMHWLHFSLPDAAGKEA